MTGSNARNGFDLWHKLQKRENQNKQKTNTFAQTSHYDKFMDMRFLRRIRKKHQSSTNLRILLCFLWGIEKTLQASIRKTLQPQRLKVPFPLSSLRRLSFDQAVIRSCILRTLIHQVVSLPLPEEVLFFSYDWFYSQLLRLALIYGMSSKHREEAKKQRI